LKILLIGTLPLSQGGFSIGGVAIAVSELSKNLALLKSCEIYIFADNAFCKKASDWYIQENQCHIFRPLEKNAAKLREFSNLFGFRNILRSYSMIKWDKIRQKLTAQEPNYRHTLSFLYYKKIINHVKPDIIHAHHAHQRPIIAWLASENKIPIVTTLHSFSALLTEDVERYKKIFLRSFQLSTKLIAITAFVKEQAIHLGATSDKIEVISNGIDIHMFKPRNKNESRKKLGLNFQDEIILFVGNLIRRKGADILIRAFEKIKTDKKNAVLVIVGKGEEENSLKKLGHELKLKKSILFVGRKEQNELADWYNACDVFVAPSRQEAQGIVFLEAMACKKACIGTKVGGIPNIIQNSKTGILFENENIEDLAEKIKSVLTNNGFRHLLGNNARCEVERQYSWKIIAQKTFNLYKIIRI